MFSNQSNETTFMHHGFVGPTQGIFDRPRVSTVSTGMLSGVGKA
jgi:hypothetical protein